MYCTLLFLARDHLTRTIRQKQKMRVLLIYRGEQTGILYEQDDRRHMSLKTAHSNINQVGDFQHLPLLRSPSRCSKFTYIISKRRPSLYSSRPKPCTAVGETAGQGVSKDGFWAATHMAYFSVTLQVIWGAFLCGQHLKSRDRVYLLSRLREKRPPARQPTSEKRCHYPEQSRKTFIVRICIAQGTDRKRDKMIVKVCTQEPYRMSTIGRPYSSGRADIDSLSRPLSFLASQCPSSISLL